MRIIAGTLRGHTFDSPGSQRTHPMSDKMRGAVFNVLGDISGLTVLDAFAGSGALGLEALSRGAGRVLFIDSDATAQKVINYNLRKLGLGTAAQLARTTVQTWSKSNPALQFDLVLADPPYDDPQSATIMQLTGHLKPKGVLVLSWPGKTAVPELGSLALVSNKNYNDSQLIFYRHAE